MAKAELGTKRTCLSCNMRFYDFNRRPIICPGCGAEFKAVNLIKSQTVRRKPEEETKSDESAVEVNIDDDTDVDMDFEAVKGKMRVPGCLNQYFRSPRRCQKVDKSQALA